MTTTSNLKNLVSEGVHFFPAPFDPEQCAAVGREILQSHDFGDGLFLSEAEFDRNPVHTGVSPRAGRNLAETFAARLDFIERDPGFVSTMKLFFGEGYQIFYKKLTCAFPERRVPEWLLARIRGTPINALNPYVKPEYRDVTYLLGSDFHMDVVDKFKWPDGSPIRKLMTFYVYLGEVTRANAPLVVMPGSHRFGATVFPHDLEMKGGGRWKYSDRRGNSMECGHKIFVGGPGSSAAWHSCLLHGAPVNGTAAPRLSLRYMIRPSSDGAACGLDEVNASLAAPTVLPEAEYRTDLDRSGKPVLNVNFIGKIFA